MSCIGSSKEIERAIDNYERENYLSGTISITKEGKTVFEKAYGKANIQLDVPNTLDTKFHIASVTKMFIAAAAVILHERGLLDLQDKPGTYIDHIQNINSNITIHHLLTHTSGLHDIYRVPNLRFEMSKLNLEQGSFLEYLINQKQLFHPGEKWSYSSTGFILMGYIMEKVTGLSFGEILDQLFFTPLQMNNTGLDNPRNINPGRAYGHSIENGVFVNADNDRLSEIDAPGELISTVRDLNKWCDALIEGSILSPAALELIFKKYETVDFDPELKYGYGWFLGDNFRLIGGGTPGFRSEVWQYPEPKVNVIMLWNYEKVDSHRLFHAIKDLIL